MIGGRMWTAYQKARESFDKAIEKAPPKHIPHRQILASLVEAAYVFPVKGDNKVLGFFMPPVTLSDPKGNEITCGPFHIIPEIEYDGRSWVWKVELWQFGDAPVVNSSCHPHQHDGSICWGGAWDHYHRLRGQGLAQVLMLVCAHLHQYEEVNNKPYETIRNWIAVTTGEKPDDGECPRCGAEDTELVDMINDNVGCIVCCRFCNGCGGYDDEEEGRYLEVEEEWACRGCEDGTVECSDCGRGMWDGHACVIGQLRENRIVCQDCKESYYECGECGILLHSREFANGTDVCNVCVTEKEEEELHAE